MMEDDIKEELLNEDNHTHTSQGTDVLDGRQENNQNTVNDNDLDIISQEANDTVINKTKVLENNETQIVNDVCRRQDSSEANNQETSKNTKEGDEIPKKRRKFKLEIDIDIQNVYDEVYDAFTDENNVYKKYRLRQKNKACPNSDEIPNKNSKPNTDDEDIEANPCYQCKMSFDSKTGLRNHLRIHEEPQKFICSLCDTDFDTNVELIQHKEVHQLEKRVFMCQNCKVAFSDHCDYLIHKTSHMKQLSYKCVECGIKYNKRGQFQNHIKTHFDKRTECPICHKEIKDSFFKSHVNNHKYTPKCVECGKNCTVSNFSYHMTTHTGVKLHQCLYCGKGFANRQQKNVHTRIHTGERPYECKICNQWFRQTTDLKRHMNSHKTEKNVSCTQCNKKFYHEESLKMHMRVHLNRDLFSCNICGEKYPNMNGLKSHTMYKHFDDRPYKCEACNVAFKDKNKLKRHDSSRNHRNNLYGFIKKKNE